jgi:hypothetical protein
VNAAKLFSDEAAAVYERATASLLKKNMLLYFAYADFEEGRLKYEKVHQIYSRFLDIMDIDPTLVSVCKCFFFLWARRHSLRMHRSLRLIVQVFAYLFSLYYLLYLFS